MYQKTSVAKSCGGFLYDDLLFTQIASSKSTDGMPRIPVSNQ